MNELFPGEELVGACKHGFGVYLTPTGDEWRVRHEVHGWLFRGVFTKERARTLAEMFLALSHAPGFFTPTRRLKTVVPRPL